MGTKGISCEIFSPKVDVVFKMLFGEEKNKDFLIKFLNAVLGKEISDVSFLDTVIKPKYKIDKMSIVDVKAMLDNGEKVDIEIQVKNTREMRSRITYYSAGMIVEQIRKGGKYSELKPVISIIISEKSIITESQKCHNVFLMLEKDEYFPFNNLHEIHILDLSRIYKESNKTLANWLEFINSENEEEFMAVAQKDKTIKAAFGELKILSSDKQRRLLYENRLKAQRDKQMFVDDAKQDGIEQVARNMKNKGTDLHFIAEVTGLSFDEVLNI